MALLQSEQHSTLHSSTTTLLSAIFASHVAHQKPNPLRPWAILPHLTSASNWHRVANNLALQLLPSATLRAIQTYHPWLLSTSSLTSLAASSTNVLSKWLHRHLSLGSYRCTLWSNLLSIQSSVNKIAIILFLISQRSQTHHRKLISLLRISSQVPSWIFRWTKHPT